MESAREEAMVEKAIALEEEMVVDDGRNMLAGYMRGYSQYPHNWQPPPPFKEGSEEHQFAETNNPGRWRQSTYRPTYKP